VSEADDEINLCLDMVLLMAVFFFFNNVYTQETIIPTVNFYEKTVSSHNYAGKSVPAACSCDQRDWRGPGMD
jgi:hypothetical protein